MGQKTTKAATEAAGDTRGREYRYPLRSDQQPPIDTDTQDAFEGLLVEDSFGYSITEPKLWSNACPALFDRLKPAFTVDDNGEIVSVEQGGGACKH